MAKLVGIEEICRMSEVELSENFQAPGMDSAAPMKGRISREATVWCGTCANWHQVNVGKSTGNLMKLFRSEGWKTSTEYGWLCPDCQ